MRIKKILAASLAVCVVGSVGSVQAGDAKSLPALACKPALANITPLYSDDVTYWYSGRVVANERYVMLACPLVLDRPGSTYRLEQVRVKLYNASEGGITCQVHTAEINGASAPSAYAISGTTSSSVGYKWLTINTPGFGAADTNAMTISCELDAADEMYGYRWVEDEP